LFHSPKDERRRHKRYLVKGLARLRNPSGKSPEGVLEVFDVSGGGILLLTNHLLPLETVLDIRFTIQGYNTEMEAKGRVVRTGAGVLGLSFLEEPPGMDALLGWLEAEMIAGLL
jgi:hypothetical protein